jgi:putative resolvase
MKRSAYARRVGVNDKTRWRWWRAGKLDASQVATGMVMVREPAEPAIPSPANHHVAISARVSAEDKRPHLESQAERLITYCAAKDSQVHQVVNEISSSVTESRPTRLKVLAEPCPPIRRSPTLQFVVVEHQERATRLGFRFLEPQLEQQEQHLEAVTLAVKGSKELEEVRADLVALVSSFSSRLSGPRRAKRTSETSVKLVNRQESLAEEGEGAPS